MFKRMVTGRRSLRDKIFKQLIWHQSGPKMGFLSLPGSFLKVVPKWVSGSILWRKRPRNPLWTHLWAASRQWQKNIFDPLLCQINCLTILALRDLTPIISLPSGVRRHKIRTDISTNELLPQTNYVISFVTFYINFIRRFFVTCGVFTRYFFVTFSWLFRGPLLSRKRVFGAFSWPPFWAKFTRTRPGTVFWF